MSTEIGPGQAFRGENNGVWLLANNVDGTSFSSEYNNYLKVPKEEGCALVLKSIWDQKDYYFTEIKQELLLFTKAELTEASSKVSEGKAGTMSGIWLFDECDWDDSIPTGLTGDGVWVCPAEITLTPDESNTQPKISFALKDDGAFVERMAKKLTAYQTRYPLLNFDKNSDKLTYIIGSGMMDESGGGSYHDMDDIVFSKDDFSKLILTAAVSPDRSAKMIVDAKETADIEHWSYGTEDGRSFHCSDEPIKVEISVQIKAGYQSKFDLRQVFGV